MHDLINLTAQQHCSFSVPVTGPLHNHLTLLKRPPQLSVQMLILPAHSLCRLLFSSISFPAECAPGWGSHVPSGAGPQNLPTQPPSCPFLVVNGANAANCRCFRCPAGHTSTGGLLNSAGAACRRTVSPPSPSPPPVPTGTAQTAYIRVKFRALASSNPCENARTARMASTLAAGIRSNHRGVRNVAVRVRSCRAVAITSRAAVRAVSDTYCCRVSNWHMV
jgi:hypothetical protein